MTNPIHQCLTMPRPREQLLDKLAEKGFLWNMDQLDLYLQFDKTITEENGLLSINSESRESMILVLIEKLLSEKPAVTTQMVLSELPNHIASSEVEIATIARNSTIIELLPNGKTIKLKHS